MWQSRMSGNLARNLCVAIEPLFELQSVGRGFPSLVMYLKCCLWQHAVFLAGMLHTGIPFGRDPFVSLLIQRGVIPDHARPEQQQQQPLQDTVPLQLARMADMGGGAAAPTPAPSTHCPATTSSSPAAPAATPTPIPSTHCPVTTSSSPAAPAAAPTRPRPHHRRTTPRPRAPHRRCQRQGGGAQRGRGGR